MPKYEQSFPVNNLDSETVLALAYEAMKNLGWDILMAIDNRLLGGPPKSWNKKGQHVSCTVEQGMLTVKSEMIHGEVLDIAGINKKNVKKFIDAFEQSRSCAGTNVIEENKHALVALRENTKETATRQQAEQEEMNKALNLTGSNLYVTYTIVALNLLVFILMALDGAGIIIPANLVHIKWGSNYAPLTLSGDWWRLFTCTFIHFGIIHVAMNMYCLFTVGIYLEPMLGKLKFTTAYACTGILASVTSLWWHHDPVNSAGASGAVFGMYGVFLALLTSNLIPKAARQKLLSSIGIFVAYNLLYGMKSGVDNAAHVGGLVSGFAIGYLYVFGIKKEKQEEKEIKWIIPAALLLTIGITVGYLQQHTASQSERTAVLNEIKESGYKDNEKFNNMLSQFDVIHNNINQVLSDTTLTNSLLIEKIDGLCYPQWERATQLINASSSFDISSASHAKAGKLLQYIDYRKQELAIQKQMAQTGKIDELLPSFKEIRSKANAAFAEVVQK